MQQLRQFDCLHLLVLLCCGCGANISPAAESHLRVNTDLTAAVIEGAANVAPNAVPNAAQTPVNLLPASVPGAVSNATAGKAVLELPANVCTREETYVEVLQVPSMQPVRIRSSAWCLEFPPRCSNYKTEMREILKVENITKTRTIRFCCAGYEGNISVNDTICKPVCLGGCGRGRCHLPDVCSCEAGYTGKHCTQRCDHDHWGLECHNECQCQNGAVCDNKSGICHCTSGWTGDFCELPCHTGTFGVMCRKACECGTAACHPQTGACGNAAAHLNNSSTHAMIETLNSTIVNITHNLDRIAKNIVSHTTISEPEHAANEHSTAKALPEVFVFKPAAAAAPATGSDPHPPTKIIVHGNSAGLLENIHNAAAAEAAASGKSPEVIHVIAGWPPTSSGKEHGHSLNVTHAGDDLDLATFARDSAAAEKANAKPTPNVNTSSATEAAEHETHLLTLLLLVLLVILIVIAASFLYVYRRYHWQRQRVEAVLAARSADNFGFVPSAGGIPQVQVMPAEMALNGLNADSLGKSFLKPLPDLPGFTQMVRNKIEEPEFYDAPSNNSSIKAPSYTYARKESLYSVVAPKSRKGSQESHMYDEIRYPTPLPMQHASLTNVMHHHHHHSQQQQQQQHQHQHQHQHQQQLQQRQQQPSTASIYVQASTQAPPAVPQHHISHLIIPPPQNAKYLQVPQTQFARHLSQQQAQQSPKVAHL